MLKIPSKKIVPLEEIKKALLVYALKVNNGNISKVAKELQISRTTVYRKLRKYGLRISKV